MEFLEPDELRSIYAREMQQQVSYQTIAGMRVNASVAAIVRTVGPL